MQKLKKLLPLWVVLGILLIPGGVAIGLEWIQNENEKSEASPAIIPMEDGVWQLMPEQPPKQLHIWESEDHFLVRELLFDGDKIWEYQSDSNTYALLSEDQPIDYSCGPAGVVVDRFAGNVFDIYYIVRGSHRWDSVDWSEQRISLCTRARLRCTKDGTERVDQVIYHDPQQPLSTSMHDSVFYTLATREDGQRCMIIDSKQKTRMLTPWFEAAQPGETKIQLSADEIIIEAITDDGTIKKTYTIRSEDKLSRPLINRWTYDSPLLKYQHLYARQTSWGSLDFFFRTAQGSLYYTTWTDPVDLFAGISQEQFAAAQSYGSKLLIPTDTGTRVYAWFRGYEWVKFDIPVSAD